jgi:hypothetical protein
MIRAKLSPSCVSATGGNPGALVRLNLASLKKIKFDAHYSCKGGEGLYILSGCRALMIAIKLPLKPKSRPSTFPSGRLRGVVRFSSWAGKAQRSPLPRNPISPSFRTHLQHLMSANHQKRFPSIQS